MKITLSPTAANESTYAPVISLSELVLTIDGLAIDLSLIPDGGQAEAQEGSQLIGIVTRDAVTIRYPYSADIYSTSQPTDWAAYEFDILDGTVPCPLVMRTVVGAVVEPVEEADNV